MFIVFLRFAAGRGKAPDHMAGHKAWLKQGFDAGVFVLAGSLQPEQGGAIFAHGVDRADLDARVAKDPFVAEGVVEAEVHEISPAMTTDPLAFLKE